MVDEDQSNEFPDPIELDFDFEFFEGVVIIELAFVFELLVGMVVFELVFDFKPMLRTLRRRGQLQTLRGRGRDFPVKFTLNCKVYIKLYILMLTLHFDVNFTF